MIGHRNNRIESPIMYTAPSARKSDLKQLTKAEKFTHEKIISMYWWCDDLSDSSWGKVPLVPV